MQFLEKTGLLNRAVEFLPDDSEIAERHRQGKGLTRPELAVLLSYVKIWLYQKILDSTLPDDPALQRDVEDYFPKALRKAYAKDIAQHQLRREIAATVLTNDLVNHTGIRIVVTMAEHDDPENIARAYLLARSAFALPDFWSSIEALDNKLSADVQTRLLLTTRAAVQTAMEHLLTDKEALGNLTTSIEAKRGGVSQLSEWMERHINILDVSVHHAESEWHKEGVPANVATQAEIFPVLV